jgi:hypothetical protein
MATVAVTTLVGVVIVGVVIVGVGVGVGVGVVEVDASGEAVTATGAAGAALCGGTASTVRISVWTARVGCEADDPPGRKETTETAREMNASKRRAVTRGRRCSKAENVPRTFSTMC